MNLIGTVAKQVKTVIPVKTGIYKSIEIKTFWIPAFAGMTKNSISQQSPFRSESTAKDNNQGSRQETKKISRENRQEDIRTGERDG